LVVCIIALFVFSFLAIFSAKYRPLAREAFRCVFLKITFRPCDAKLDEKIKAGVVGTLMEKNSGLAKFVNVHFELLSFIFTILMIASLAYVLFGIYNYVMFGTCDPANPESCMLTVLTNGTTTTNSSICTIQADFVEFYGTECPHCIKMIPIVSQVESETGIKFEKLEVWHNYSNQQIMQIHATEIQRDCGVMGVPAFVSIKNKKAVCGEMNKEELKKFVLENK